MLTKRNIKKMAASHGMSYGVKILPDSPLFNNTQNLVDFANALYAAGAKDMQERCVKVCSELNVWECGQELDVERSRDLQRDECIYAIRALEAI